MACSICPGSFHPRSKKGKKYWLCSAAAAAGWLAKPCLRKSCCRLLLPSCLALLCSHGVRGWEAEDLGPDKPSQRLLPLLEDVPVATLWVTYCELCFSYRTELPLTLQPEREERGKQSRGKNIKHAHESSCVNFGQAQSKLHIC